MCRTVSKRTDMYRNVSKCVEMYRDVSKCIKDLNAPLANPPSALSQAKLRAEQWPGRRRAITE
eukprot:15755611-Heterocapsa_arctica.AAC.1